MLDYSEGVLEIKARLKAAESALLANQIREARLLFSDIRFIAEEMDSHLCRQFPQETGHG